MRQWLYSYLYFKSAFSFYSYKRKEDSKVDGLKGEWMEGGEGGK